MSKITSWLSSDVFYSGIKNGQLEKFTTKIGKNQGDKAD